MAGEWLLTMPLVAAALMLGLAVWVFALEPSSRVARAFALFLLLRSAVAATTGLEAIAPAALGQAGENALLYYLIGSVGALAYFLLRHGATARGTTSRWAPWAVVGATLLAEVAYFADHCVVQCGAAGKPFVGPLGLVASGLSLATGVGAFVMARRWMAESRAHSRTSNALLTAGFTATASVDGAAFLTAWLSDPSTMVAAYEPGLFATLVLLEPVVGLAFVVATLVVLLMGGAERAAVTRVAILASVAGASGAVAALATVPYTTSEQTAFALITVWRLALPVLAAYALLRYRLFDIDVKAQKALSRTLVGGAVVLVFFVASESAQDLVGEEFGPVAGIGAAALLVFVFEKLQRSAERVVESAIGRPRLLDVMTREDKLVLFRDLAQRAWEDGALERHERAILDGIRERLDLSLEETRPIEQEAERRSRYHRAALLEEQNEPHA